MAGDIHVDLQGLQSRATIPGILDLQLAPMKNPVTGWEDFLVNPSYMGDYIAVTADALGSSRGVIVAWGDNSLGDANVLQRRF